jgi:hypothetical protein
LCFIGSLCFMLKIAYITFIRNTESRIIGKPNNLKVSGARTPQGPKQNTQYRIRSDMHKGEESYLVKWLILSHLEQAWSMLCTYPGRLVVVLSNIKPNQTISFTRRQYSHWSIFQSTSEKVASNDKVIRLTLDPFFKWTTTRHPG